MRGQWYCKVDDGSGKHVATVALLNYDGTLQVIVHPERNLGASCASDTKGWISGGLGRKAIRELLVFLATAAVPDGIPDDMPMPAGLPCDLNEPDDRQAVANWLRGDHGSGLRR